MTELLGMCSNYFLLLKQEEDEQGQTPGGVERHTGVFRSWCVSVDTRELKMSRPSKSTLLMT